MDVRRFTALELSGNTGEPRRRRIVLGEFVVMLLVTEGFGAWLLATDPAWFDRAFGFYLVGVGLNYLPLTGYAIALARPGALEAELAGVDRAAQRRRYAVLQFWILVPLSIVALFARSVVVRRR